MRFPAPLVEGRLLQRYKRFLADVELADGSRVTAACPNTGSMLGCRDPGSRVWLSTSDSPTRKYRHTWEIVEAAGTLVGINTGLPNRLVREAVETGVIAPLAGYASIRGEVAYGEEKSRVDLLLESPGRPPCYVEVKNVTAAVQNRVALFPDAVSERGAKHLREFIRLKSQGARPVLVFCVQRADVDEVRPADAIDPAYGRTLREAIAAGVEVMAWRARVGIEAIAIETPLAVRCP